jgi:HEAT repeat protein
VRVAAVECLGGSAEDLSYLIEQVSAKAKEVRAAAYRSLAAIDDPAAAAVLQAAIAGKDLDLAAAAIARSKNDNLPELLIAEIAKARNSLPKLKDKQHVSEAVTRLCALIAALPTREHPAADELTLDLFGRRGELAKAKGGDKSGADVVAAVIERMAGGHSALQATLARAHADLSANELPTSFGAARWGLPAAEVYELFSPYLLAFVSEKKAKPAESAKGHVIIEVLGGGTRYWHSFMNSDAPRLDPRWLDLAVRIKNLNLVSVLSRPGHKGAQEYALAEFESAMKKDPAQDKVGNALRALVRLGHPKAVDALIAAFEKVVGKSNAPIHWHVYLIPDLPKAAIPQLEAVVPKLQGQVADQWLAAIDKLRAKD